MQHLSDRPYTQLACQELSTNAFFSYLLSETIMSGHKQPVCFRAVIDSGTTSKLFKLPHHRPVEDRCILLLHTASSWAERHAALWLCCFCAHYCWWKTPAPTPERWRDILLSTAGRATLHPSLYTRGRAGEASLEFLSFDGMGEVCRHVTKHSLYDQLPVRQIQSTAMLKYRHSDSVLLSNRICCTIRTLTDKGG